MTATSTFDPDVFLGQSLQGEMSTIYEPCPVGEYPAVCEDLKARLQPSKDGMMEYLIFDLRWRIDDQQLMTSLGRNKLNVFQSIFVDRNSDGSLDISKGKNIQLGKLREALGQNTPGQPWAPSMIRGMAARVKVDHEINKNDGSLRDKVVAVSKL